MADVDRQSDDNVNAKAECDDAEARRLLDLEEESGEQGRVAVVRDDVVVEEMTLIQRIGDDRILEIGGSASRSVVLRGRRAEVRVLRTLLPLVRVVEMLRKDLPSDGKTAQKCAKACLLIGITPGAATLRGSAIVRTVRDHMTGRPPRSSAAPGCGPVLAIRTTTNQPSAHTMPDGQTPTYSSEPLPSHGRQCPSRPIRPPWGLLLRPSPSTSSCPQPPCRSHSSRCRSLRNSTKSPSSRRHPSCRPRLSSRCSPRRPIRPPTWLLVDRFRAN